MNYFDGEVLDLSGLVVTLSMDNGKTEDVAFESFSDKGIVTLPANNTVLRKFIFLY